MRVSAPSRLHLGDLDPYGLGRFGYALLVGIKTPRTIIEVENSDSLQINSEINRDETEKKEILEYSKKILNHINENGAKISVITRPPRHYGFGSTTQLVLSLGVGIFLAYNRNASPTKVMKISEKTSAGGFHSFQKGGFIVSGGFKKPRNKFGIEKDEKFTIPPLITRKKFPKKWRFVVTWPKRAPSGAGEKEEKKAFDKIQKLEPPKDMIRKAHFLLNTKLLPSLIDENPIEFGEALQEIQHIVGTLYSPAQESVYNPNSENLINILKGFDESLGVGQSSWGPAVYSFVANEKHAKKIGNEIRKTNRVEVKIAEPDNVGFQTEELKSD